MINSALYKQLTNEFRSSFIYLSKANESEKYIELARNKIESGMKLFNMNYNNEIKY